MVKKKPPPSDKRNTKPSAGVKAQAVRGSLSTTHATSVIKITITGTPADISSYERKLDHDLLFVCFKIDNAGVHARQPWLNEIYLRTTRASTWSQHHNCT
ncbi:hypothetical protein IGI04_029864 [Brassica rapa subsp. trilocularis]|uniref:Uncharacterized protein n=1 Tax=Brassica rapa subsp. trilocularis TaxID=1813537 RepID=A0ABQ7LP17_BRACM|nr:hypothetical protein IGI04_029864 [Brassica rapa subsp. trilocularis]